MERLEENINIVKSQNILKHPVNIKMGVIRIQSSNFQSNFLRYCLSSAGYLYLCMWIGMYVCSHTIQPVALKPWHNIPHVII